ncbi:MAG: hypothetical protein RL685_5359 [Pseudomonadota bacterium]|jgi:hypothetical protein
MQRFLLACLAATTWACSDVAVEAAASPAPDRSLTGNPSTLPSAPPQGTQTGEEGDQPNCGESEPAWDPVSESFPLPTHYIGGLELESTALRDATLTLSNPGPALALRVDPSGNYGAECIQSRQRELDWALSIASVVTMSGRTSARYYTQGNGELNANPTLDEVALEAPPPTLEDFRALGEAMPWNEGDGPIGIRLHVALRPESALLQVQWSCNYCSSTRVGLTLADGNLAAVH